METDIQEKIIFRYLLGDLPEAEQFAVEQEFFAEGEKLEQIWALENQLLDRYVRGGLTAVERNLFEKNYLASPVHRQRLAFAETLVQAADAGKDERARDFEKPHSVAWWAAFLGSFRGNLAQWGLAAAMLLLIAGGFWLFTESTRLREQLNQLQDERASEQRRAQELETEIANERQQRDRLAAELEDLRQKQAELLNQQTLQTPPNQVEHHSVASFFLSPLSMRSEGETPQLKIPKETTEVRLQMKVQEPEARNFLVSLRTVDGTPVWSGSAGKPRAAEKKGSTIAVRIPVNKFSANEYILTLSAHNGTNQPQEIARYFFRVSKP